jgi:hypothetical protein
MFALGRWVASIDAEVEGCGFSEARIVSMKRARLKDQWHLMKHMGMPKALLPKMSSQTGQGSKRRHHTNQEIQEGLSHALREMDRQNIQLVTVATVPSVPEPDTFRGGAPIPQISQLHQTRQQEAARESATIVEQARGINQRAQTERKVQLIASRYSKRLRDKRRKISD